MKKINSKQTGRGLLSPLQSAVSMGMVFAWIAAIAMAYFAGLPRLGVVMVMVVGACVVALLFFVIIVDKTRFNRIVTYILYLLRARKGDTSVDTFVLPMKQLKKTIPIEQVHEDGLIEYTGKKYGVLFKYDPPMIAKNELEMFHKRIENIVNSFPADTEVSFHFYNMIDRRNPLADVVLNAINSDGKTLEQKQHLHGMYEDATANDEPTVATEYLLSIKLGRFKSTDHAMIAYKSSVPGILKAFRERGLYTTQVVGENDIAIEFRNFAIMERY